MKRRELALALLLPASTAATGTDAEASGPRNDARRCHPQTQAEVDAKVVPTDYSWPFADLRRYGGDPTGVADSSAALQSAASVGHVIVPAACRFKIKVGARRIGPITVIGFGPSSQLLCDAEVLTVEAGTGSVVDNLQLSNITEPWIITRDPSNWSSNIAGTLRRSNEEGYQPTVNDHDIWDALSDEQQQQQIGPVIHFGGDASDILVSRIHGRFVQIAMYDTRNSCVRDCNIRGGKGFAAAISFWNINGQAGQFNKALRNSISYSSFSGIAFARNSDFQAMENQCVLGGESGIKTWCGELAGRDSRCYRGQIQNNSCKLNYYDGIDATSNLPPDDRIPTFHQIQANHCDQNGGDGINCSGQFNQVTENLLRLNGRFGLWGSGLSLSRICGNFCIDNNSSRVSSQHDLGIVGKLNNNYIAGNVVWAGPGQNNYGIYAPGDNFVADNYGVNGARFFFGNPGDVTGTLQNNVSAPTPPARR